MDLNFWSASNCFPWLQKEEAENKDSPQASTNSTAEQCGLLNFERCTQTSSKLTFIEYFPCAKALCWALYMSYFIVIYTTVVCYEPHFTDEKTEARGIEQLAPVSKTTKWYSCICTLHFRWQWSEDVPEQNSYCERAVNMGSEEQSLNQSCITCKCVFLGRIT